MSRKSRRKRKKPGGPDVRDASPEGQSEATASREKEKDQPKRRRTAFDSFRDNMEALIIAIILAIIIRHFAVEAFEIPTGSMAPTLYGMHVWTECPNCDTKYNIAIQTDSGSGEVTMPFSREIIYEGPCKNPRCDLDRHGADARGGPLVPGAPIRCLSCGTVFRGDEGDYSEEEVVTVEARCPLCDWRYRAVIAEDDIAGGNKILVNKFAYELGRPERWDVGVFEFDQWKNYIKRIVGLPGETIHIFDGDIYVNGEIARKSAQPYVQEIMWRLVSDSDVTERGLTETPAWAEFRSDRADLWDSRRQGTRWSVNHQGTGEMAVLEYQRGFDNYMNYNLNKGRPPLPIRGAPPGIQVGDKKVAFRVTPLGGEGWVGAEIRDGDFTFRLRLPVGEASESRPATLERVFPEDGSADAELRAIRVLALPSNVGSRVEFENVDDRVTVRIDGDEVLALDYTSCRDVERPPKPAGELPHHLRLLAYDAQATFEAIRVFQDIYYLSHHDLGRMDRPPEGRSTWTEPGKGIRLGEDEYLALGDNSASSSDSRYWGAVPEKNLMGKALVVFWPVFWPMWPPNFQWKFIR